jgi:hypothetical protein
MYFLVNGTHELVGSHKSKRASFFTSSYFDLRKSDHWPSDRATGRRPYYQVDYLVGSRSQSAWGEQIKIAALACISDAATAKRKLDAVDAVRNSHSRIWLDKEFCQA